MGIIYQSITSWILQPFTWSKWVDICTFSFGHEAFLLQGKVNQKSNAKRFRVQRTKQIWINTVNVQNLDFEALDRCGLICKTLNKDESLSHE